jgi:serine/threonine protein kinase
MPLQVIKNTVIKYPDVVSSLARDWVSAALVMDANKRASVSALLTHPWITGFAARAQPADETSPTRTPSFSEGSPHALHRRIGADYDGADKVRACWCLQGSRNRFAHL